MHLSDRLYAVEYARTATTAKTSPDPKDGRRGSITALANPIGTSHNCPTPSPSPTPARAPGAGGIGAVCPTASSVSRTLMRFGQE